MARCPAPEGGSACDVPARHRRRGAPEIGLRLGVLSLARRVTADSMPHVPCGMKRPSYFGTTRTHCKELAAEPLAPPDFLLRQTWCLRRRRRAGTSRALRRSAILLGRGDVGWRWPFGARRQYRVAGSGAQRFLDASSCRVIRAARVSTGGVGHAGCRRHQHILASGPGGHEREPLPGVRSRTPSAGIPASE